MSRTVQVLFKDQILFGVVEHHNLRKIVISTFIRILYTLL